jgi:hypothetical protein
VSTRLVGGRPHRRRTTIVVDWDDHGDMQDPDWASELREAGLDVDDAVVIANGTIT